MSTPFARAALALALLVSAAGCGQKPADSAAAVADAAAPAATIRRSADLLKRGEFVELLQNTLPPVAFEKVKSDWNHDARQKPITDEDRERFATTMAMLTAPNAEQTLYADLEPKLKEFEAQYQQQIPMYVMMGSSWLQGAVQQSKTLSDADKQQAVAAINALGAWVQKTRFTEPDAVKQVLAIAARTAREIDLKTLDEARALSFEQSMQKARVAYLGIKDALAVYGLSLDATFDSVKPEVVSNDGQSAKVAVAYTLLDTPLTMQAEMVNRDGHWYGKHALEQLEAPASGTAAPPAPVPATPASAGASPSPH
ncbi:MAG TPA: hypothetical protein VGC30_14460 [Dokdonella sp.]